MQFMFILHNVIYTYVTYAIIYIFLFTGRRLLADNSKKLNCTPRSIDQFPDDFMTEEQRKHGGVLFHIAVSFYIFAALAVVCDDYFVPALEKISDGNHFNLFNSLQ